MGKVLRLALVLVSAFGALLSACGGAGSTGGGQSSPSDPPSIKKPNLELQIVGLKSAMLRSAARGGNPAYTLNVTAAEQGGLTKNAGKRTVLYSKTVSMLDVKEEVKRMERSFSRSETADTVSLVLPEGMNAVGVEIAGPQGIVASEEIAVETTAADTASVIAGVEPISDEFAPYTGGAELNVALYTTTPAVAPDATATEPPAALPDDGSARAYLFAANPDHGELIEIGNVRAGHGGSGYVEDYREGGVIGFLASKETNELSVFIRADDGSMTPLATPPAGTTRMTLAQSPEGDTIYILDKGAGIVRVYDRMVDGSLAQVGQRSTGVEPREIFTMPGSRLLVAANQGDNTLSVFPILADGNLGAAEVVGAGIGPKSIAHGYGEQFVYVANSDKTVSRFKRGEDNRLTLEETIHTPVQFSSLVMDTSGTVMEGIVGQPGAAAAAKSAHAKWSIFGWDPATTFGSLSSLVAIGATVILAVSFGYVAVGAAGALGASTTVAAAVGSFVGGQIFSGAYNMCSAAWSVGKSCTGYINTPEGIAGDLTYSFINFKMGSRTYLGYRPSRSTSSYTTTCVKGCGGL